VGAAVVGGLQMVSSGVELFVLLAGAAGFGAQRCPHLRARSAPAQHLRLVVETAGAASATP
jgi:hypothetical protein